jgi:hypothetical protein
MSFPTTFLHNCDNNCHAHSQRRKILAEKQALIKSGLIEPTYEEILKAKFQSKSRFIIQLLVSLASLSLPPALLISMIIGFLDNEFE